MLYLTSDYARTPMATAARLVRKQLSLTPEQDRELKRRSRALGVSESEIVRRALDAALTEDHTAAAPADSPLAELLAHTRLIAEGRRLDEPFDRDALYDEARGT